MPRGITPYDEARIQGRLWHPRSLGAKFRGLWNINDLSSVTCDGSGNISQINDGSGYGYHQVQATSGDRPALTLNSGPRSNRAVATLAADFMAAPIAAGTYSGGMTAFSVWIKTGALTAFNCAPLARAVSNLPAPLDHRDTARLVGDGTNLAGAGGFLDLGTATIFTNWNILVQNVTSAGVFSEYVNGTFSATFNSAYFGDTATTAQLGARDDHGTTMNGKIAIVFAVAGTLSQNERQLCEGWLAWECWGANNPLAAVNPFKNRPPLIGD